MELNSIACVRHPNRYGLTLTASLACLFIAVLSACGGNTRTSSSETEITAFVFGKAQNGALKNETNLVAEQKDGDIEVTFKSLISSLRFKPTISLSPGATVSPRSGEEQDFSGPVIYTVTAEDGSVKRYTVTVSAPKTLLYKGDPSSSGHGDKFSLGDFDSDRLIVGKGLTEQAGMTLQQQIIIKKGGETIHSGSKRALAKSVSTDGSFAVGIANFAEKPDSAEQYAAWAALADGSDLTIEATLYAEGGTTELATAAYTARKSPDGAIYTWRDLQNMKHKLDGSYVLRNDISFPVTGTQGFESFKPVGELASGPDGKILKGGAFTGSLDGGNKTITGLYINHRGTDGKLLHGAGLFTHIKAESTEATAVKDLKLVDPKVIGGYSTGTVAGVLETGWIRNVSARRERDTMVSGGFAVGGLVGTNGGTVQGSVSGTVEGTENGVGGLAGFNLGTVIGNASGLVKGRGEEAGSGASIGGLVGFNDATFEQIRLEVEPVGKVRGTVSATVTGKAAVGALVGDAGSAGSVIGIASGKVNGAGATIGGLVGSVKTTTVIGYWDIKSTGKDTSAGGTAVVGISDIKNVEFRNGGYFDGDKEVFNADAFKEHFNLPGKAGAWPTLKPPNPN